MKWQLIDEGFPGLGWRSGPYTVRPSNMWRGEYTLRHDTEGVLRHGTVELTKGTAQDHKRYLNKEAA